MAIPQPGFVGPSKEEFKSRALEGFGNAARGFAQTAMQKKGLDEQKRQFNFQQKYEIAQDVLQSQHGGDWVAFSQANAGLTKDLLGDLYGKGTDIEPIYQSLAAGDNRTAEQITKAIEKRAYIEGWGRQGQQEGGDTTPVSYDEEERQPAPAPSPATNTRPLDSSVPGPNAQAGYMSTPNTTGAIGPVSLNGQEMNSKQVGEELQQLVDNPTARGNFVQAKSIADNLLAENQSLQHYRKELDNAGSIEEEVEVLNRLSADLRGMVSDRAQDVRAGGRAQTEDFQQAQTTAITDKGGRPAAKGQENADFALNTETLSEFNDIEVPAGTDANTIAKRLASGLQGKGASEEAARFLGQGTKYLRSGDEEDWQEYDAKAQKYFGVDGETMFSIRNQMFDNIAKGRPVGYMPPEDERDTWWWTGKDMPIEERLKNMNALEDPDVEEVAAATKGAYRDVDTAKMNEEDLMTLNTFIDKATGNALSAMGKVDYSDKKKKEKKSAGPNEGAAQGNTRVSAKGGTGGGPNEAMGAEKKGVNAGIGEEAARKATESVVKRAGLDASSAKHLSVYINKTGVGSGSASVDISDELMIIPKKAYEVGKRVIGWAGRKAKGAATRAGKMWEKWKERGAEKLEEGEALDFEEQIGVSRARAQQIYNELSGAEPMSYEVRQSIPQEEKEFALAQRRAATDERRVDVTERSLDIQQDRLGLEGQRFSEAKRQFNENLKLQYAQMPDDKSKETLQKMQAAELAMKEMNLKMLEDQYEAFKNGEGGGNAALDFDTAAEIAMKTSSAIKEKLIERSKGDPEMYQRLYVDMLKKNENFKNSEETLNFIISATSGVGMKEVEEASSKGRLGTGFNPLSFIGKTPAQSVNIQQAGPSFSASPTVQSRDPNAEAAQGYLY